MKKTDIRKKISLIIHRGIATLLATILLSVSVPFPGFASQSDQPLDDFEINIVAVPQGFIHTIHTDKEWGQIYTSLVNYGSKLMLKKNELVSSSRFYLGANADNGIPLNKIDVRDLTNNRQRLNDCFDISNPSSGKYPGISVGASLIPKVNSGYPFAQYIIDAYKSSDKYAVICVRSVSSDIPSGKSHTSGSGYSEPNKENDKRTDNHNTSNTTNTSYPYNTNNELTGAVITAAYPHEAGTTSGDTQNYTTSYTTIKAVPKKVIKNGQEVEYVFDHWEKNGVDIGGTATMEVQCNGSIDAYVAVFKPEAQANGVFATVSDTKYGTTSGDAYRQSNGQLVTQTTITANPKKDENGKAYVFSHWTESIDGESEIEVSNANPYTVAVRDHRDVYTAHFDAMWGVKATVSDAEMGTVSGGSDGYVNGAEVHQTTLQAYPKSDDYVFDHWELDGKQVSSSNPYTVEIERNSGEYKTYKAVFKTREGGNGVFATVSDAKYGTTSGDTYRKVNGQLVTQTTITANPKKDSNGKEYVFNHWKLSVDGKPAVEVASSNPYTVAVRDYRDVYTAVFDAMWGVKATVSDAEMGTVSGGSDGYVNGAEVHQTTLQAYPKSDDYVFDHWELDGKQVSSSNPYTVEIERKSGVYKTYKAVFKTREGGNGVFATVSDTKYGTASGDTYRKVNGQLVTQTTITANPKKDENGKEYVFNHWNLSVDGADAVEVSVSNPYTVAVRDHKDVYTAVFDEMWGVKVESTEGGTATGATDGYVNGSEVRQTTLQAYPKSDEYVFDHWELDGKQVSSSNPYTVEIERKSGEYKTYKAVFKTREGGNGVFTTVSNAEYGTTSGDTYRKVNGQLVNQTTIQAFVSLDDWEFDHWELSTNGGDFRQVSTSNPYTVNVKDQRDLYKAVFKSTDETYGVYTTVSNADYGTTSGDTPRKKNGQKIDQTTLTATANKGYAFSYWEYINDSGTTVQSGKNPFVVQVRDRRDLYTAVFKLSSESNGVYTKPDDPAHGTTSGDSLKYIDGQEITQTTIQAFPSSNKWVFDSWELVTTDESGETVSMATVSIANPYTVKVDDRVDTYIAHFRLRNGAENDPIRIVRHKTGVTDKIIEHKERLFTVPVFGVDRNYILTLAEEAAAQSYPRYQLPPPFVDDSVQLAQLRTSLQIPEEKDAEAIKESGFEFISSDGEIINITPVEIDTAVISDAGDAVYDKFGDMYHAEAIAAVDTAVPVGFVEGKRTIVWSGTDAKNGDRLLLVQEKPTMENQLITPIADENGRITFTTSDFNGSRFILIKVTIK